MIRIAKLRIILFSLLAVANLSCAALNYLPALPVFNQRQAHIELRPCHFPNHSTELLCGKYDVYENRATMSGRMIALNVLVAPATSSSRRPDPIFFLAGGPGQGQARMASAILAPKANASSADHFDTTSALRDYFQSILRNSSSRAAD